MVPLAAIIEYTLENKIREFTHDKLHKSTKALNMHLESHFRYKLSQIEENRIRELHIKIFRDVRKSLSTEQKIEFNDKIKVKVKICI